MRKIQIVTFYYDDKSSMDYRRVMIEQVGDDVFRVYISEKYMGKISSPFLLTDDIYTSPISALNGVEPLGFRKLLMINNEISDLITTKEISEFYKMEISES